METNSLLVYKASAGSGKTFTLAVEYIKLLMQAPYAYRRILAVTFTNKATGEMKERILSQLYGISVGDPDSEAYLKKICDELQLAPEEVRRRCKSSLEELIHDYTRFQVTTIDSFFQMVTRNLARELGLGASMNIELDTISVLDTAVDKLIEGLDINSPVFAHILAYAKERIEDDKNWDVVKTIKSFGQQIFNEKFMQERDRLHRVLQDKDFSPTYKKLLSDRERKTQAQINALTQQFRTRLQTSGATFADIKNGGWIDSYLQKLERGELGNDVVTPSMANYMADIGAWKKAKVPAVLTDALIIDLQNILNQADNERVKALPIINSCKLSREHINNVCLLAAIDEAVRTLNGQTNRFLLAETNILLQQMLREGDSPFVFEKIGTSIRNVMIDEFQDTSSLQWENFKQLLTEGLSQGADDLIVGDVKQAIYRWRNGDWKILGNLEGKFDHFPIREIGEKKTVNRRSEENIISFNNAFFTRAVRVLDEKYQAEQNGRQCTPLIKAYSDVEQAFPEGKPKGKGYVKVLFPTPDEALTLEEATHEALANEIERLLAQGVRVGDITILVRKNKYTPPIADYLKTRLPNVPVVSNDAYRLDASPALLTLIEALRCLARPDDKIARKRIEQLATDGVSPFTDEEISTLRDTPLYELVEELVRRFHLQEMEGQGAYLMSFFDAVTDYLDGGAADIDSFIRYWDEHLYKHTIPAGNIDGVHIYTIHNSKGLEFHTVLIPFCNWKMENERAGDTVWCTPAEAPYDMLPLLPISYGKAMNDSVYHDDFLKEQLELWVDNLNVLYVAFTRARANLIVLGQGEKEKEDKKGTKKKTGEEADNLSNVSKLMQKTLAGLTLGKSEEGIFEYGTLCPSAQKQGEKASTTNLLLQKPDDLPVMFNTYGRTPEFKQSNQSAAFIHGEDETDKQRVYLNQGRLLHRLFSDLRTTDDIEPVMKRMEAEGLFTPDMSSDKIRHLVERALGNPKAAGWFSPEWEVFNECNIVSRNEEGEEIINRRPDRVIISHDRQKVIVVDFKFGTPKPEYVRQVSEYMSLLRRMGYPSIQGYLWYVYSGLIEEVRL